MEPRQYWSPHIGRAPHSSATTSPVSPRSCCAGWLCRLGWLNLLYLQQICADFITIACFRNGVLSQRHRAGLRSLLPVQDNTIQGTELLQNPAHKIAVTALTKFRDSSPNRRFL
jgi:hypothetical protein